MHIGQTVLLKHEGKLMEGKITDMFEEDVNIELADKTIIQRKYWAVRKIKNEN